jgi:selenocysteine-specific elongation factor
MVAGAGSMDGVILVVAADDGVMPQTREHMDILTLLGVRKGLVALTKIDRVDEEEQLLAMEDVRSYLAGTFLENAPILPISSVTGEGYDTFLEELAELVHSIEPKRADGVFRMPVERSFSIKGHGTVISGIPVSGSISVGQEVELLPHVRKGTIRGIQVYGQDAQQASCGQCAALNIRQWDASDIKRGSVLAQPDYFAAATWVACRLQLLRGEKYTLKNAARVRFHTGTSETNASAYLLDGDRITNGAECFLQFRLDEPLVMGPGDHFIVRSLSPVRTIGGGVIIEPLTRRMKRTQNRLVEGLDEQAAAIGNDYQFVEYCLRSEDFGALARLQKRAKLPAERTSALVSELVAAGRAIQLPDGSYMHCDTYALLNQRLIEIIRKHHQQYPDLPGMSVDELRTESGLAKPELQSILELMMQDNKLVERKGQIALPEHEPKFDERELILMRRVEGVFKENLFHPPNLSDVASRIRADDAECYRAIELLLKHKRLMQIEKDLYFHIEAVERAKNSLISHFSREKRLESVRFKYMLETTRKFAIPLLDYFDRIGVTVRVGNTRYLKGAGQAER